MVQEVKSAEEFKNLLESSIKEEKLIVVDFFTTWCGPCKLLAPVLEELSEERKDDNVMFVKVDVEEQDGLGEEYDINSIPTMKYFKDGKEVESFTGFKAKSYLNELIQKHLTQTINKSQ